MAKQIPTSVITREIIILFPRIGHKNFFHFGRLLDYAQGKNQEGRNISLIAPVLVDIGTPNGSSPYSLYFYLPQEYQANPPIPISYPDIPVKSPPKKFAAVRRFGGFSDDKNIPRQASALKRYLKGTLWESASKVEHYSQAGYNTPFERSIV